MGGRLKPLGNVCAERLCGDPGHRQHSAWLFLQYDLIIIAVSSLSWAFALLCHAFKGEASFSPARAGLMMTVGALIIGPGGTVSLALLAREKSIAPHPVEEILKCFGEIVRAERVGEVD